MGSLVKTVTRDAALLGPKLTPPPPSSCSKFFGLGRVTLCVFRTFGVFGHAPRVTRHFALSSTAPHSIFFSDFSTFPPILSRKL